MTWGLRQLKRVQLLQVDHPIVDVECGGARVTTKPLPSYHKNSNYEEPLQYMDVVSVEREWFGYYKKHQRVWFLTVYIYFSRIVLYYGQTEIELCRILLNRQ
jgi:hypothetical protein